MINLWLLRLNANFEVEKVNVVMELDCEALQRNIMHLIWGAGFTLNNSSINFFIFNSWKIFAKFRMMVKQP